VSRRARRARLATVAPAQRRYSCVSRGAKRARLATAAAALLACIGAPAAHALTISPLEGTPDASPHTQISFLGIAPGEIHDVAVVGSSSGAHGGRLEAYASAPGASFLPSRGFTEGEHVTVTALVGPSKHEQRVSSAFTVARLAPYHFAPMSPPPAARKGTVQSFVSQPNLKPPSVSVTLRTPQASEDDVFIAANHGYGQWGPMIFNRDGQLVWFKPVRSGETAMDLQVESYEHKPVLVWWQGYIADLGVGFGTDEIYNTSYKPIGTISAGNGYWADLHEAQITPQGSAFVTAYTLVKADLSSVGGSREAALQDAVLQEVDIKTGLVMFEWHADGHVAFDDSYSPLPPSSSIPWDYFHINSVSLDPWGDGNFIISSRNTWAGYEIDGHTGAVLWRLGGRHPSFRMGPGTGTAWQHDIRWHADGTLTLFDDGDIPKEHSQSRAIRERIDWHDHTVELVGRDVHHPAVLTSSQGNDQVLSSGNSFVGWGAEPYFSEFTPSGQMIYDAHISLPGESYRAYTYPWTGTPAEAPAIAVRASSSSALSVYASWNGATNVTSWRVLAGASPAQLAPVATVPRSGFETTIPIQSTAADFAVQAIGAAGQTLGSSATVPR